MLEVGRITRPHGVRGDVSVVLTSNRDERVGAGSVLHSTHGPLTVRSSRPHKSGWIVAFEECAGREEAEALRGVVLSAPPIEDPDELWIHDLIGASVVDTDGVDRGTVVKVVANPASDLLELEGGALVPIRFVTAVEPGTRIDVDVPEGLFDLAEGGD